MLTFADPIINGGALWRIIAASFIGGAGVAIAFGVLVWGVNRSQTSRGAGRLFDYLVSTVTGVLIVAAVAVGIYAMAQKPSSSPTTTTKATTSTTTTHSGG